MKIKINFLYGETNSRALGVERISTTLTKELTKRVNFKVYSYRIPINLPLIRQLYIYLLYPLKIFFSLHKSHEIIHIYSQGYAYLAHFLPKDKLIITCCDLIPYINNSKHNLLESLALRFTFLGLKKANKIIAISRATKKDLIRYLNISEKKITIISPIVDKTFKRLNKEDITKIKQTFFPDKKIILYVGSYLPNKNLPIILKAFQKIKLKINNLTLVIVNEKNKLPSEYKALINDLNIEKDIYYTGYISDQKLVELYNCSDVFIFPSLYEGFGFPPLEAMVCGCPVITSNTSSLPEVVGDAAIMVDPSDLNEIAKKTILLLKNQKIRDIMINKGFKQAKKFRNRPLKKVMNVYKELI